MFSCHASNVKRNTPMNVSTNFHLLELFSQFE